ncbi:hypothetical protein HNP38_000950 [Chryseobacterium defluvii]|uniref:Uncharacterized protein n=1 Tax=Chryseobacterium defluvii TaxID=160396 RepID=A0A840KCE1_9FLAO|nr:hypothetical protein [Chryseobacterium defluvii]MBB4805678.1 hypothetical protein [Chryseobacterium defluvii]
MRPRFSIIFCLLLFITAFGQKKETLNAKDKAIAEHFKNDYKKKNYKKFAGKITVKDNKVQFDDKVMLYDQSDKLTALLLREGLIYPQLLTDYQMDKFLDETEDKTQKRFLKLQKDPRTSFDVNNVKLTEASELTFLSSNPHVKRFKVLCRDNRISSTLTYFIELTNKNATDKTSTEDFIKNSKLTYIYQRTE